MKLFRALVFVSVLILGTESPAGATNWTWTDSTPTSDYFVDLESTFYKTDLNGKPITNIIFYWQKIDHAPEAGPELSEIFGDKFRNTSWSVWKKSIHMIDKTMSTHIVYFFDVKGRLIDVFNFSDPICSIVSPRSLDDSEFRVLEKYVHAHRDAILLRTMEMVEKKTQNHNKENADKE